MGVRRFLFAATLVGMVVGGVAFWRSAAKAGDRPNPLAVGERAPDVRLVDQHGRDFSLADTLVQRDFVVIAFYPKAFTSG